MKNSIIAIVLLLATYAATGQDGRFNEYKKINDPTLEVNAYEKTSYISQVNGDLVFHLWTDYTSEGVDIIIKEANRIFKTYDSDFNIDEDMFIIDEMFYAGEEEFFKDYNFSNGGTMKVGMMNTGEYEEDYGYTKAMILLVRFPQ
jgi:hypothetical protein